MLTVEEIYRAAPVEEAQRVLNTLDSRHPMVADMVRWGTLNINGHAHVAYIWQTSRNR